MATSAEFCNYILDCLGQCGSVTARKMMGEYCLYFYGKLIGLVCDNCFLVKQTPTSVKLLNGAPLLYPYKGSKTLMLAVENPEDSELMQKLLNGLFDELPSPPPKAL